jgi:hypothetical protein
VLHFAGDDIADETLQRGGTFAIPIVCVMTGNTLCIGYRPARSNICGFCARHHHDEQQANAMK